MRYLIPVAAVMAVITAGSVSGWSNGYEPAAEPQVEADGSQSMRSNVVPKSGIRYAEKM